MMKIATGLRGFIVVSVLASTMDVVPVHGSSWPQWAGDAPDPAVRHRYESSDAIVLQDGRDIKLKDGGRTGTHRRVLLVLTEDGIHKTALTLTRGAFSDYSRVKVWVALPNGKVRSFDDGDGTLFSASERRVMLDQDILLLQPPGIVPGSRVAVEYRFNFSKEIPHDLLEIQEEIPVLRKSIAVTVEGGWGVQSRVAAGDNPGAASTTTRGNWQFDDLAAVPKGSDPFAPSPARSTLCLSYTPTGSEPTFANWKNVADWVTSLFREPSLQSRSLDAHVQAIRSSKDDPVEVAGRLARRLRYYAIEVGWGAWVPRSPDKTLGWALGDCKDKSLLMVALLRALGIEAYPVLAISPADGYVHRDLPSPFPFNHCIVGIRWKDRERRPGMVIVDSPGLGPLRLFDPTLSEASATDVPVSLEGGTGLAVATETNGPLSFPASQPEDNLFESRETWDLSNVSDARVQLTRSYLGATRLRLADAQGEIRASEDVRKTVAAGVFARCPTFVDLNVTSPETPAIGAWKHDVAYRCPNPTVAFGDFKLLELPVWSAHDVFATSRAKGDDVSFQAYAGTYREVVELKFALMRPIELPSPFVEENSLGSVRMDVRREGDTVVIAREFTVRAREIPRDKKDESLALERALRRLSRVAIPLGKLSAPRG